MHPSTFAPVLGILFALLLLLDWYAFQGIKTLTSGWENNPWLLHSTRWGYWLVSLALPVLIIFWMRQLGEKPEIRTMMMTAASLYLTVLITKLVFVVPLFGEDVVRVAQGTLRWFAGPADVDYMPDRRKFVSQLAIGIAAIPFTSFLYGIVKGKYDYRVHRHVLHFPDLPETFNGFTITQISDVHAGSFDNVAAVERGIRLINAQESDLFVFTGDLVNNTSAEFEPWKEAFSAIRAPYGQFSVLGNHDYGDYASWPSPEAKAENLRHLHRLQTEAGFRLLLDEHTIIEKDGQQIALVGIQNWGKGFAQYGDLGKALRGVDPDAFKILLSHDPTHWEHQVKEHPQHIHLTLAGHTHGMQMGVEIPGFKWSPIKYRYPKWAGMYRENGRHLHINRGFGFLGFSGRVGILPEITVIELRKG
jgi:uncharacterized protein